MPVKPLVNSAVFDWDGYVESMAALNRLPLDARGRAGVVAQLERIEALARLVVDFPLDPEVEPAPVFRP